MRWFVIASQVVIALGLLNVWLLRTGKPSPWRGGGAANMREEFAAYGLPAWAPGVVGFLKIGLALLLITGIWLPALTRPAAIGVAVLMVGAIAMHVKVGDSPLKSLPAATLLLLSLVVALL
jgi:uncharacterized membrane protein YphA (DoxX/SURF4 family)